MADESTYASLKRPPLNNIMAKAVHPGDCISGRSGSGWEICSH